MMIVTLLGSVQFQLFMMNSICYRTATIANGCSFPPFLQLVHALQSWLWLPTGDSSQKSSKNFVVFLCSLEFWRQKSNQTGIFVIQKHEYDYERVPAHVLISEQVQILGNRVPPRNRYIFCLAPQISCSLQKIMVVCKAYSFEVAENFGYSTELQGSAQGAFPELGPADARANDSMAIRKRTGVSSTIRRQPDYAFLHLRCERRNRRNARDFAAAGSYTGRQRRFRLHTEHTNLADVSIAVAYPHVPKVVRVKIRSCCGARYLWATKHKTSGFQPITLQHNMSHLHPCSRLSDGNGTKKIWRRPAIGCQAHSLLGVKKTSFPSISLADGKEVYRDILQTVSAKQPQLSLAVLCMRQ